MGVLSPTSKKTDPVTRYSDKGVRKSTETKTLKVGFFFCLFFFFHNDSQLCQLCAEIFVAGSMFSYATFTRKPFKNDIHVFQTHESHYGTLSQTH